MRSRRSSGVGGVAESWLFTNVLPFREITPHRPSLRPDTYDVHSCRQVSLRKTFVTAMYCLKLQKPNPWPWPTLGFPDTQGGGAAGGARARGAGGRAGRVPGAGSTMP